MKVFLYARKSTDDEERQMLSIDAQLNELREYARKESFIIAREFVESMTAKEPGRPIFNEMLRLVERGEADAGVGIVLRQLRQGGLEGVVVVLPNWWGQRPAVLNGWIDRVFRPGGP